MAKSKPKNDKSYELTAPKWVAETNDDSIKDLSVAERNDFICYQWFIKGAKQTELAKYLGLAQSTVATIIGRFKRNDVERSRAVSVWEKDISVKMRRKALQTVDSLNPDGMPDGSKAITAATLIDKARLIDDETTENIGYSDMTRSLAELEKEEEELKKRLRIG